MPEFRDAQLRAVRIKHQDDIPAGPVRVEGCVLEGCSVAVLSDATEHLEVTGARLVGCEVAGGGVRGVILRDVVVDGLKISSLPQVLGCLFDRVVLKGRIDQLVIDRQLPTVHEPAPFYRREKTFYDSVEWALDIRELDCPDLDIRGLPGRLIRRDPQSQAMILRSRLDEVGRDALREVDYSGTPFKFAITDLLASTWEDVVVAAPRTGKGADRGREVIADLRRRGIAEPS